MKFKLESLSLSSRPDQLQVAQCIGLINDSVGFSEHEDQSEGYASAIMVIIWSKFPICCF
jgi:hypothetical protein